MDINIKYNNRCKIILTLMGVILLLNSPVLMAQNQRESVTFEHLSSRLQNGVSANNSNNEFSLDNIIKRKKKKKDHSKTTSHLTQKNKVQKSENLKSSFINIDTDGDGVLDINDIDDDNDGILDAIESPNCFYAFDEASVVESITTNLPVAVGSNISMLTSKENVVGQSFNFIAGTTVASGATIFKFNYFSHIALEELKFNIAGSQGVTGANSPLYVKLYGSNVIDGPFVEISTAMNIGTTNTIATIAGTTKYKFYEIRSVGSDAAGNATSVNLTNSKILKIVLAIKATVPHNQSFHPKPGICMDDFDNDGIPNHLDSDSDNDGCSDAFEATSVATNITTIPGSVDTNGLSVLYNYTELNPIQNLIDSYNTYAKSSIFNACSDSDQDGIFDKADIDDDNDGIPDAVESPSCFYLFEDLARIKKITSDYATTEDISLLYDNVIEVISDNFNFSQAPFQVDKKLFEIEFFVPLVLRQLRVNIGNANGIANGSAFAQLQGMNELGVYENVANTAPVNINNNTGFFTVGSSTPYKKYAIVYIGSTATGGTSNRNLMQYSLTEITYIVSKTSPFIASLHPKPGNCNEDTDNDGIANHLDTDSDQDGCSDALEAGATLSNTANFTFGGPYNEYGIHSAIYNTSTNTLNYTTTYNRFALSAAINLCNDFDSDGIKDVYDIDDDNDGVTDADESPNCFYSAYEASNIISLKSDFNGNAPNSFKGNELLMLYNKNFAPTTAEAFKFQDIQYLQAGDVIFDIEIAQSMVNQKLIINIANGLNFNAAFFVKLHGSNDKVNFSEISVATDLFTTDPEININSQLPFQYYRVIYVGSSATGGTAVRKLNSTNVVKQLSFIPSNTVYFNSSLYPKQTACSEVVNGVKVVRHQNLDSDLDGCSDAFEAGATNNNSIAQFNDINAVLGISMSKYNTTTNKYTYKSTYNKFATLGNLILCHDKDGDNIPDPIDIDDDNDGIIDMAEKAFIGKVDRNILVGYLQRQTDNQTYRGPGRHMLLNLHNYGFEGIYNNLQGVVIVPFETESEITVARLNELGIDIFFVGSGSDMGTNQKASTNLNNVLKSWVASDPDKKKFIFGVQNSVTDYGYTLKQSESTTLKSHGTLGTHVYENGYWPITQYGTTVYNFETVNNNIDILMTDSQHKPVIIFDRNYNAIFMSNAASYLDTFRTEDVPGHWQSASEYGKEAPFEVSSSIDSKVIGNTWTYLFNKIVGSNNVMPDFDGDAIPNHFDLDSDNDGCSDALEGGATTNTTANYSFISAGGSTSDSNSDGLYDALDASEGVLDGLPNYHGNYEKFALNMRLASCLDTDSDNIHDVVDLDDDNDGILDIDEGNVCNQITRDLVVGYLETDTGKTGLLTHMLSNKDYFGQKTNSVYNKISGVSFVALTEAQLSSEQALLDNAIDVFFAGSTIYGRFSPEDKLPTAINNVVYNWAKNHDKVVIVMQNNGPDYGYVMLNEYPRASPNKAYGFMGNQLFQNGYFPIDIFVPTDQVQMVMSSFTNKYDVLMVSRRKKATFARDRDTKLIIVPDVTVFTEVENRSTIPTDAEDIVIARAMKTSANIFAYAFDTFLENACDEIDTDGDGIPDHKDLDSDNDGCFDAIEGNKNVKSNDLNANGSINTLGHEVGAINTASAGVTSLVVDNTRIGQGIGHSTNANIKDADCYLLTLTEDFYSGTLGQSFVTGSVLNNDWLQTVGEVPVIGDQPGEVVVSESGDWPDDITLDGSTGEIKVEATVTGSFFELYYQVCVNGAEPVLCKIQKATITLCTLSISTPAFQDSANFTNTTGVYKIPCGSQVPLVVNLTTLIPTNLPGDSVLTFHSDSNPSAANVITSINSYPGAPSSVIYAAYYNQGANCYSSVKAITIFTPICAVDDDYSSDPAFVGQVKNYTTIFANDRFSGLGFTMPDVRISFTSQSNNIINANGSIEIPTDYEPGLHQITYTIRDMTLANIGVINESSAVITIKVLSCTNVPKSGELLEFTKTGISTLLGFETGLDLLWPNNIPNGYLALESPNKGFVITRIDKAEDIANPVEGMLIYDITAACVKLYNGTVWNCIEKDCK